MRPENLNEKMTFKFIPVNGTGTVALKNGGYCDVFVYGYFTKWNRWSFIVHQDLNDPELITVSEASTGYQLRDESYYSVEDALHFSLPFIEEKHYYFATYIARVLVKTRTNLLSRNTVNLQTIAMDTVLWL